MELKNKYFAVGVMSGTSLDGLDIALCKFIKKEDGWKFQLIDSIFIPYTKEFRAELESVYQTTARHFVEVDAKFGTFIAKEVNALVTRNKIPVDLIASHGQTIFHAPESGYTCQIGSGAHIAALTGITTVCDFRSQDVVIGGQGAPLVPIGDELLFSEYSACLNLGGFANISYKINGKRIAYDVCAVNIVLNHLSAQLSFEYDKDGDLARSGKIKIDSYNKLNELEFFKKGYPKSLGKEWVDFFISPILKELEPREALNTFTQHIAYQICNELEKVNGNKVLVTGGGAKNKFLMELICQKSTKNIIIPDNSILDMKEAIIFAFLGVLRLRNETNCLAIVTGAKRDSSTGAVYIP